MISTVSYFSLKMPARPNPKGWIDMIESQKWAIIKVQQFIDIQRNSTGLSILIVPVIIN